MPWLNSFRLAFCSRTNDLHSQHDAYKARASHSARGHDRTSCGGRTYECPICPLRRHIPATLAAGVVMAVSCPILVILGPTASGKTDAALAAARAIGAEILSVDSMQVYRGMDIGTAKPTEAARRGIHHHLVDVDDPTERVPVARFVETADAVISHAAAGGLPLVATA